MLRIVTDNDFRESILLRLFARNPDIDLVRVREVGMTDASDAEILEWAAIQGRIVATHDVGTMIATAYSRVSQGLAMPRVLAVHQTAARSLVVEDLSIAVECWEAEDMRDTVRFIPLR